MTIRELYSLQEDDNKLKSLYMELARHEDFNPYKNNIISDMPKAAKKRISWNGMWKRVSGSGERLSSIRKKSTRTDTRLKCT